MQLQSAQEAILPAYLALFDDLGAVGGLAVIASIPFARGGYRRGVSRL